MAWFEMPRVEERKKSPPWHQGGESSLYNSPRLLYPHVKREAPVLITDSTEANAWCGLVFELDHFALCGCWIRCECDKQIACDALLDSDSRSRILLVSAK